MPDTKSSEKSSVPLPRHEDVINAFFNLIDEDRATEAVSMLTLKNISDEATKQAWGVQFNAIDSVAVKSIESAGENTYKVTLAVVDEAGIGKRDAYALLRLGRWGICPLDHSRKKR